MIFQVSAILYIVAALVSNVRSSPKPVPEFALSPCPDYFTYESANEPGKWTGHLVAKSEEDLHGIWIRLVFEHDVKKVIAEGFEAQFADENPRDILVKNRTMLLKAFTPITLKITVLYDGSDIPRLVEYRLNARRLCPDPNTLRTDYYQGDADSETFFSKIQAKSKQSLSKRNYKCGTATDPTKQPYPWRATVHFNHAKSTKIVCSAVLIDPSFFITPAHCVTFENGEGVVPNDSLLIHLGQDLRVKVSNVIVHPGYRAGYLDNDLALLRTPVPLEVTDYVTPICLSEKKEGASSEKVVLVGNEIEEDGVLGSKVLEAATVRISKKECETLKPLLKDVLVDDTYCVSFVSDNKNCVGSSGNGLITSIDGRSTLRGVVTLGVLLQGEKGCNQNTVNVVTATAGFTKWIQRVIYR